MKKTCSVVKALLSITGIVAILAVGSAQTYAAHIRAHTLNVRTQLCQIGFQSLNTSFDDSVTGYEICHGKKADLSDGVTTKTKDWKLTLKNLSPGKTYYVKVRGYVTVKGKNKYSPWSKIIKITAPKSRKTWYTQTKVVAHALGSIDGVAYTNSLEAFQSSYQNGFRVFEADLLYTSDKKIVLWHSWEENADMYVHEKGKTSPSYDFFMSHKIAGKYTPLSLEDLMGLMGEYQEIYMIIDTKSTSYMSILKKIVRLAGKDETILNRFVIQLYDYEQLSKIKGIYSFENYLFTMYKLGTRDANQIRSYCKKNNIAVVGFPPKYAKDKTWISKMHGYGLTIFTYTINTRTDANLYKKNGIDGIFTDDLKTY